MFKLCGYLKLDGDRMIGLTDDPFEKYDWEVYSIQRSIKQYFGHIDISKGLGQEITTIEDCNIRIYYTDEKCSLEEAESLVADIFDGGLVSTVALDGYSEFTITGYKCEDFEIGGHDLDKELRDHIGKYCWFIIERGQRSY